MSITQIATTFYAVAMPMSMVILAYLFWCAVERRDRSAAEDAANAGPVVSALRLARALRLDRETTPA